jgi:EamA domain-containing membrane protein RarD
LYWKQLADIHPVELIAHRHLWSLGFVVMAIAARGAFGEVRSALGTPAA